MREKKEWPPHADALDIAPVSHKGACAQDAPVLWQSTSDSQVHATRCLSQRCAAPPRARAVVELHITPFKASCTGTWQLCGSNTQPVQASFSPPAGMIRGVNGRTGLPASSLCRRHAERPAHADAVLCWLPTGSKAIYPRLIPCLCLTLSLSRRYLHDANATDT